MRSGRDGSGQALLPGFDEAPAPAPTPRKPPNPVRAAQPFVPREATERAASWPLVGAESLVRPSQRPNLTPPEEPDAPDAPRVFGKRLLDRLPDVRDGLTRVERIILWQLGEVQQERRGRNVPSAMLYGRVVEYVSISVSEFERTLARLAGGNDSSFVEGTCAGPGKEGPWRRDPD